MGRKRKQYGRKNRKQNTGQRREQNTRNSVKKIRKKSLPGALHVRDVNSREIFKHKKLVCQFLRDYTGIPIFSDIRPEDIEDVTAKYRAYLGVEFESDSVKKVHVRVGREQSEVYVIPLIEHKSGVDYDVQMQLLRYMSVIWYDYGKRQNELAGTQVTARKSFRYPLIIPIVYYEGAENWTADTSLWKRIELGEEMREYIPDFSYKVIRIHDYTNAQIREHENEMSLVIMFNRIQSPEDYSEFMKSSKEYMTKVLTDTPQELMNVLLEVFWALLMKMNVPQDEAQELVENMGVRNMGYLFANAEKMDIQAERRNTKEARERADAAETRADEAETRADAAETRADAERTRADAAESLIRKMLGAQVRLCKKEGFTKDETRARLHEVYQVEESVLDKYYEGIWQEN